MERKKTFRLESQKRLEIAEAALRDLADALNRLDVQNWTLPNIRVRFVQKPENDPELGCTGNVTITHTEILFDERFETVESQRRLEREVRKKKDYPGMQQTMKHEMAHAAMWSVTGMERQAAVRLLDEGWASLVEHLGTEASPDIPTLIQTTKRAAETLQQESPDLFARCMDFEHPVSHLVDEDLNAAEYVMGRALMLWVLETQGKDRMIELLKKAPTTSLRNSDVLMPAKTDPKIHAGHEAYRRTIAGPLYDNSLPLEQIEANARIWEAKQFQSALLEITDLPTIQEAQKQFYHWLTN